MLAGRYRVVALLGSGGMGEVYRADDIKLGQPVALKFLRGALSPELLERLYAEVRIGRQVSHPNVCRLYDVVEVEGHTFLAMEYVDGEDLASLLARIGRLPPDKALDIARDLCAGPRGRPREGGRPPRPQAGQRDDRRPRPRAHHGLRPGGRRRGARARTPPPARRPTCLPSSSRDAEVTARSDLYALGPRPLRDVHRPALLRRARRSTSCAAQHRRGEGAAALERVAQLLDPRSSA